MFSYYFRLGIKRLRRNPVLTGLMILTVAIGIAASMSTLTVLYIMSGNPIPEKSDRLIVPLLDNLQLTGFIEGEELATQITHPDAQNFLKDKPMLRQTAIYGISAVVEPERKDLPKSSVEGLGLTKDFFPIFNVPFQYGGAWSAEEDEKGAYVVVISQELSERLFAGENPVGKLLRMMEQNFTIVGVLADWQPLPRYYRLNASKATYGNVEDVMIPFNTATKMQFSNIGDTSCNGPRVEEGYAGFLRSECTWIQFWFELSSSTDRAALNDYLRQYISEQKKLGRFERPIRFETYDVMEWLDHEGVIGKDSIIQTLLALGFLFVCLINTIGLMLAKFTARASEVGVRRALGANKRDIFSQFLIEAAVIGLVGGLLGLILSYGGLALIAQQSESMKTVAKMNGEMLFATLCLSIFATLLAGILPTWRACQIKPAAQLKSQ